VAGYATSEEAEAGAGQQRMCRGDVCGRVTRPKLAERDDDGTAEIRPRLGGLRLWYCSDTVARSRRSRPNLASGASVNSTRVSERRGEEVGGAASVHSTSTVDLAVEPERSQTGPKPSQILALPDLGVA